MSYVNHKSQTDRQTVSQPDSNRSNSNISGKEWQRKLKKRRLTRAGLKRGRERERKSNKHLEVYSDVVVRWSKIHFACFSLI